MIYLIGGPSRSGKTIVTKELKKHINAQIIPMDYIEAALMEFYLIEKFDELCPFSALRRNTKRNNNKLVEKYSATKIINSYERQGKTTWPSIKAIINYGLLQKENLIIDGYQITANFVQHLNKSIQNDNIVSVFLYKKNTKAIHESFKTHTSAEDWLMNDNTKPGTLIKYAELTSMYGERIEKECKEYNLKAFCMDGSFHDQVKEVVNYLKNKSNK